MERISIFNYEAFYLDYLEGNLSEEDTALLLAFLEANPDLKMDDDALPTFELEDMHMDAQLKKELKQTSEDEAITLDNVEYFLIAQSEGLLDTQKEDELNAFVAGNKVLSNDQKIYAAVHASPDLSLTYKDKDGLKQKGIVLWPYLSIAAAASVIAFFMVWSTMNTGSGIDQQQFADQESTTEQTQEVSPVNNQETNDVDPIVVGDNVSEGPSNTTTVPAVTNTKNGVQHSTGSNKTPINQMERRPTTSLASLDNQVKSLQPISEQMIYTEPKVVKDYTLAQNDGMSNPIEPITKFVSEKTKTPVDFRRQKKTEQTGGGFFLKIGKFEVSRKRN